jgi:hypothetical protein
MLAATVLSNSEDFVREFQRCCRTYTELRLASAWCGDPGHVLPYSYLEGLRGRLEATIGVSFSHTHPDSIEFLQRIGADVRIFRTDSGLFHPKVYLFAKGAAVALFVGSSNLTYSGFFDNIEASLLLEGTPTGDARQQIERLRKQLSLWHSERYSLRPSPAWLASYRRSYARIAKTQRRHRVATPPRLEEKIASASWLRNADWNTYYRKVNDGLKRREREGQGYHNVLDAAEKHTPIPWRLTYFGDLQKRRVIGGIGEYGWLGHIAASGHFRHLLAHGSKKQHGVIVKAINRIARLEPPVAWPLLESRLHELAGLGFTMKVWGRLVCLVRPDLYCTVASVSVRANLSKTLGVPQAQFERPEGYVQLIRLVHASPWFNSEKPKDKAEAAIWRRRTAFLDAVFY